MQVNFVTFALLKLGWNTEVKHSKQLARFGKVTFVNFPHQKRSGNGPHKRWADEEEMKVRLIIKTDNYL